MKRHLLLFSALTAFFAVSPVHADGPNLTNDANTKFQTATCESGITVTDAYVTYFGGGPGDDNASMVFKITVPNNAYDKYFYVKPDDQGPYVSNNEALPYTNDPRQMTMFVYEGNDGKGNDQFAILDERVGYNTKYVYDVAVEMNGKRSTCSNVTIVAAPPASAK